MRFVHLALSRLLLLSFIVALGWGIGYVAARRQNSLYDARRNSNFVQDYKTFSTQLALAVDRFREDAKAVSNSVDSFPIRVIDGQKYDIFFEYYSAEALAAERRGFDYGEFSMPRALAPRFNFWRKVYVQYSQDQFAIHSSAYPEIVLEVVDVSKMSGTLGPEKRKDIAGSVAQMRRQRYQELIYSIIRKQARKEQLTPSETHVVGIISRIDDPLRLEHVAATLRVQRGQREYFVQGLERAHHYWPAVENEFVKQGIPRQLSRLAMVESSFNTRAVSKVGASGVYQLMPATGQQYLIMTDHIDERNCPLKAANAAARLLKFYYSRAHSWPLAITAYNHGIGSIQKSINRLGTRNFVNIIANYDDPSFGFASQNFYTEFVAALFVSENSAKFYPDYNPKTILSHDSNKVGKPTAIAELMQQYKMSRGQVLMYNPDLRPSIFNTDEPLPRGYTFKFPKKELPPLLASSAMMGPQRPSANAPTTEAPATDVKTVSMGGDKPVSKFVKSNTTIELSTSDDKPKAKTAKGKPKAQLLGTASERGSGSAKKRRAGLKKDAPKK